MMPVKKMLYMMPNLTRIMTQERKLWKSIIHVVDTKQLEKKCKNGDDDMN